MCSKPNESVDTVVEMFDYKNIPDGPEDDEIEQYLKRFLSEKEDIVKNKGVMYALERLEYIAEKEIMTKYCRTDIEEVSNFIIHHLDYNDASKMDLILTITVQMPLVDVWNVIINEQNIADRKVSDMIRETAKEILEYKYTEFMDKCYKRTVQIANTPEVNMDKQNGKRKQRIINDQMIRMTIIVFRIILVLLVLFDILNFILIINGNTEFDTATIAYLIATLVLLCFILFYKKLYKDAEKNQHVSVKSDTTNISKDQYDFRKQVGINTNNNQKVFANVEIETKYFGKLLFHKESETGNMETLIEKINFGGTDLDIDIIINQNSHIGAMFDKLEYICRNSCEFMHEVYPQLAEFCNGIDLYDENDQRIDNFTEDLLIKIYKLGWINVQTNSERENIIMIVGQICDNIDQEVAIIVNCTNNNIMYELL